MGGDRKPQDFFKVKELTLYCKKFEAASCILKTHDLVVHPIFFSRNNIYFHILGWQEPQNTKGNVCGKEQVEINYCASFLNLRILVEPFHF